VPASGAAIPPVPALGALPPLPAVVMPMPPLPVSVIAGIDPLIPPLPLITPPVPIAIATGHPVGPGDEPSAHLHSAAWPAAQIALAVVLDLPSSFAAHAASATRHDHHHAGVRNEACFIPPY
jgi:hypothetical protein